MPAFPVIKDTHSGDTYLPQDGPTYNAKIEINGDPNIPQPSSVRYTPPVLAFKTLKGKPIYQGLPQLELTWANIDINGFQALSVAFFTNLNSEDGPLVDIWWPSPYEAGRYVHAKAYMEWPMWDTWEECIIKGAKATFSSFSLEGQGVFF